MFDLDLTNVFEAGLRDLYADSRRYDEDRPHVSHLGKCLLQTHFSRQNAPKIEMTSRGYQFLMKGLHDEEYVTNCFERGLPQEWMIDRSVIQTDLTGHVDMELCNGVTGERVIVEIKTTQWHERWEHLGEIGKKGMPIKTKVLPGPRPEPSITHRLQALGYARRRDIRWYSIFQWDRALHGFHQYPGPGQWYDAEDPTWLAKHDSWTKLVLDLTDPASHPVEMGIATIDGNGQIVGKPPEDWMCGYCDYSQCARNINKNNTEHAIEEMVF